MSSVAESAKTARHKPDVVAGNGTIFPNPIAAEPTHSAERAIIKRNIIMLRTGSTPHT